MKDIDKLLEKYWAGDTTLEEEKLIKKHFSSENSQDNNLHSLFSYFESEKEISYPGNITIPKSKVFRINFSRELAVAASIVILLGAAFLLKKYNNNTQQNQFAKYEVKDPAKAKEITQKALAMLAKNYNKGETTLSKNVKNINKIDLINSLIKNN